MGVFAVCKECKRKYYLKNKNHISDRQKAYYVKNREKYILRAKTYRNNNKESVSIYLNAYYKKHKEIHKERDKKWRKINPDKAKKISKRYYLKNIDKIKKYAEKYRLLNKDKIKMKVKFNHKKINVFLKIKRDTNPLFKLECTLRSRIRNAFLVKKWTRSGTIKDILGTTYEIAKKHIESQFIEAMNWNNHGNWHIDHIIPLSTAKNENELIALCNYKNLQPLWAIDNMKKRNIILSHKK